jgi:hypothetical protein
MAQARQKPAKRSAPVEDMNSLERRLTSNGAFCKALGDLVSAIQRSRAGTHATSAPPVPWEVQLRVLALLAVAEPCFQGVQPPDGWDTGKTPKALADFAPRLRAMAAEIEHVNRSLFFYLPDLTLPPEIEMYADHIERCVARAKWQTRRPRGHSRWVFELSDLVNRVTGSRHDEMVSRLLNTAAIALNVDFQVDATALASARSRKKHRT